MQHMTEYLCYCNSKPGECILSFQDLNFTLTFKIMIINIEYLCKFLNKNYLIVITIGVALTSNALQFTVKRKSYIYHLIAYYHKHNYSTKSHPCTCVNAYCVSFFSVQIKIC